MQSTRRILSHLLLYFLSVFLVGCQTLATPQTKLESYLYGEPSNPCNDAAFIRDGTVCVILLNRYMDDQKKLTYREKEFIARTLCKNEIDGTFYIATGDRGTDFFMCSKDMESAEAEYEWKLKRYFRTQI